jgi:hypothetical protein
VPIIILPTTDCEPNRALKKERFDICYNTYKTAKENGDKNVYFLDVHAELNKRCGDYGYVERNGGHLNDVGSLIMAKCIEEVLEKIIDFKI